MISAILQRLAMVIPNVVILTFLLFASITSFLGTPAAIMLGEDASPEAIADLNQQLGFDGPVVGRYLDWVGNALQGDLGRSYSTGQAVSEMIVAALPLTLELGAWAIAIAFLLSATINSFPYARGFIDAASSGLSIFGLTVPNFFLGLILLYVFAIQLRWLPTTGWVDWSQGVWLHLRHMILPVLTLSAFYYGSFTMVYRSQFRTFERSVFVQVARSKGLSETRINYRHILPNAVLPLVTYAGLSLGQLVGGAVVTETIFSMPGMGRLIVNAIAARDFPVMIAGGMVVIVGVMIMNLIADILYGVINPLVRFAK